METTNFEKSQVKLWLNNLLNEENLAGASIDIVKHNEENHDNFGDTISVKVSKKDKELNLLLKYSNSNSEYRKYFAVEEFYNNEIYFYEKIFVEFVKFQKGAETTFDSVPHYYRAFTEKNLEVLICDDVSAAGYSSRDPAKPLSLEEMTFVVKEYGKFHAISAAMQDQNHELFEELIHGMKDYYSHFSKRIDFSKLLGLPVNNVIRAIADKITFQVGEKLNKLKKQIDFITGQLMYDRNYFLVVNHGQCCRGNYYFKYEDKDKKHPTELSIYNWQLSRLSSPLVDLSFFLYSCLSPEDYDKFNSLCDSYYESFCSHVKHLGSQPDKIFPLAQFESEWKVFGKVGLLMAFLHIQASFEDSNFEETDWENDEDYPSDDSDNDDDEGGEKKVLGRHADQDDENMELIKSQLFAMVNHAADRKFI